MLADLAVGHALGDQVEDPPLLVGEAGERVRLGRVAEPLEDLGGERRVEERLAASDAAHAVDEVGAADLLEDVAGGAGHDRAEERLVVGERGEHQAGDLGVLRADLAAHLDPVAVGEADVEDGDVRAWWRGCGRRPPRRCRPRRRPRCRPRPRAARGGRGGRPRGRRGGTRGSSPVQSAAVPVPNAVGTGRSVRSCLRSPVLRACASCSTPCSSSGPTSTSPSMLRRIVEAAVGPRRRPLRRARRARRHRHPPGAVHHRRDRRRDPRAHRRPPRGPRHPRPADRRRQAAAPPRPQRSTPTASGSHRTTRRCGRSSGVPDPGPRRGLRQPLPHRQDDGRGVHRGRRGAGGRAGAAAGVAIENARLHARVQDFALVEDRERIARDLHDTVIQRLFATGLSLAGRPRSWR